MDKRDKTARRLGKLVKLIRGHSTMLIVMQDNPDPDAIASAVALRELANRFAAVRCSITHGGTIGRGENRELVQYLGLNLRLFKEIDLEQFDLIAMVDTQPGTGNNSLPTNVLPDIVFDHHPIRRATRSVPFTDVRNQYGATSTILWEYLLAAKSDQDIPLATALLYGIRSDTQDFGREATQADIRAIDRLYPIANKRMLGQIQLGRVPGEYYQLLLEALKNATMYGPCCISSLKKLDNPDMIGEMADLLLRHEQVIWTLCYGFYAGKMLLSVRSEDPNKRADTVMRHIVQGIGTGGGHPAMAGGQIPLKKDAHYSRPKLERLIKKKFLQALGVSNRKGKKLVR